MKFVWFTFRIVEMIAAFTALSYHVQSILNEDHPAEHVMYLCGIFFGFGCLSLFLNAGMILNQRVPILYEAIIAFSGSLLFLFACFASMYLVEKDDNIKFTTQEDESGLSYFLQCKGQIISVVCLFLHMKGIMYIEEPTPHVVIFCGIFFGFAVISVLINIGYFLGVCLPAFLEAVIAFMAFLLYLLSSLLLSYYNEVDSHLEYLSDDEEHSHSFFFNNECQSIASLVAGVIYLLHSIFAIDYLVTATTTGQRRLTQAFNYIGDEEQPEDNPLKLHFFCKPLFKICICCEACNQFVETKNNDDYDDDDDDETPSSIESGPYERRLTIKEPKITYMTPVRPAPDPPQ